MARVPSFHGGQHRRMAPPIHHPLRPYGKGWTLFCLVTAGVWILLVWGLPSHYSPDSWAYHGLAQSLWSDTYALGHFRAYTTDVYSAAFPPLWPFVIATLGAGMGVTAGHTLAATCWWLTALVWEWTGRQRRQQRGWGLVLGSALLMQPDYLNEIAAGRAIPLAVLLMAGVVGGLMSYLDRPDARTAGWLGLATGLLLMARFDAILWIVPVAAALAIRGRSPWHLVALCAAYAFAVSPWIAISWWRFDAWFFTDNGWVATALRPGAFVTDWPPDGGGHLFGHPLLAVERVLRHVPVVMEGMVDALGWAGLALAAMATGLAAYSWDKIDGTTLRTGGVLCAGLGLGIAPMLLTGYDDPRYFAPLWGFFFWWVYWATPSWPLPRGLLLAGMVALIVPSFLQQRPGGMPSGTDQAIVACLPRSGMALFSDATEGARISVLYGVRTGFIPRNLLRGDGDRAVEEAFIARYHVTALVDSAGRVPEDSAFADVARCSAQTPPSP